MKNYILSIVVLCLACSITFAAGGDLGEIKGANGSDTSPWLIEDFADFQEFCDNSDCWDDHVRLECNLDLTVAGVYTTSPIAPGEDNPYTGHFDGNGHFISNLIVYNNDGCFVGLFGFIREQGSITDLGLVNINITGREECGGICGRCYGLIANCFTTGNVTGTQGGNYIGGLVGSIYDPGKLINSYSSCMIHAQDNSWALGGLVGILTGTVEKCYSIGSFVLGENVGMKGGIVAWVPDDGQIINSVWNIETYLLDSGNGLGATTEQMSNSVFFTDLGWDFIDEIANGNDDIWYLPYYRTSYPILFYEKALSGSGTKSSPFLINNLDDFQTLSNNSYYWEYYIRLECDLDLSAAGVYTTSPIGSGLNDRFTGHFNGNNHIISNLSINGDSILALFGYIDDNASICNLGIKKVSVTGSGYRLAGLCAFAANSIIDNCYSTGSIAGKQWIGGLLGCGYQTTVTNSYSTCSVTGSDYVGGLIGHNLVGFCSNCYSTGSVNSIGNHAGGAVGLNQSGSFLNCYSEGTVEGNESVGGFAGSNNFSSITNCYSIGTVSGNVTVGGMVGDNLDGDIVQCFWDIETSGTNIAYIDRIGSYPDYTYTIVFSTPGTAESRMTTEMQMASTYIANGWDFNAKTDNGIDDIWHMPYQATGYPMLFFQRDIPGDITGSYGVDMQDFSELAQGWQDQYTITDLSELAEYWLEGK